MNQPPPVQGLVAGKYELVRLLGRGGMGSVWEARHASLGTPSAIKFIEAEYANSAEAKSRFDKEAKAAASIQSKHAIQIYDHGVTDDGKPYIVMELLQGEPLDKTIERQRLSLPETAKIMQQVCRGLARAHERGIIHRDLKPENIFLVKTPDDDEPVAKVLDFGIAKMQSSVTNPSVSSTTKTGAVLGTPFYMSPEQARGLRNVDHRADVWSLGVIAFKCLTGKLPFDGESVGDLLVKICTAPLPIPSQLYPGIPPSFDAWFMRALEREPDRRFGTVTELSDALSFAAGIATRSHGTTPSGPVVMGMVSGPYGTTPSRGNPGGSALPSSQVPPWPGQTPHPAAMTNAPFTSESIPGVPSHRGKVIAGSILALVVGVIGAVALFFMVRHKPVAHEVPTNGVGLTTTPASAPIETPIPPVTPSSTSPILDPSPAKSVTKVVNTPPKTARQGTSPVPPPLPPVPSTTPPPPPPTPSVAPAPTPSTKKPNKHDPGY